MILISRIPDPAMPRHPHGGRRRMVGAVVAITAVLAAVLARSEGAPDNPARDAEVDFRGMVGSGDRAIFSLTRRDAEGVERSVWLARHQSADGLRVRDFDPSGSLLQIECDGRLRVVRLRGARSGILAHSFEERSPAAMAQALGRARALRFAATYGMGPAEPAEPGPASEATPAPQVPPLAAESTRNASR